MAVELTHIEAIEKALRIANRPLTSKEICEVIKSENLVAVGGATPWKTIAARLAQDILHKKEHSFFKRTHSGRYSLRTWNFEPELVVKRRKLNPLDETIKAVPTEVFSKLVNGKAAALHEVNLADVLAASVDVIRCEAEETEELVQLIPTFVIQVGSAIVSYKRTKRLPESRLHYTVCLNFGGHLQSEDIPSLFMSDENTIHTFLYRELFEELKFSVDITSIDFEGILYLTSSMFERQHAGLVYKVVVDPSAEIVSLEPGMHTDLRRIEISEVLEHVADYDSWSERLVRSLYMGKV